jgi:hydrogenase/urease accessory protein HupE
MSDPASEADLPTRYLGRITCWPWYRSLPITFPLIMAIGGAAGMIGMPLPGTEIVIALSVIVLGGVVATAARLNLVLPW